MKKNSIIIAVLTTISINTLNAQIKVANGGKVGIGTNNPQEKLHVYGSQFVDSYVPNWGKAIHTTVHYPQACSYNLYYGSKDVFYVCAEGWLWCSQGGFFGSDYKIKKNINKIQSPLSTIKRLNGIQFDYNDTINSNLDFKSYNYNKLNVKPNVQRIGLIAQEVEDVLPGIVKTLNDSTKAVSYTDLISLLIEAMKEQQTQIETLQAMVYNQEQEIGSIKESICDYCIKEESKLKSYSVKNEINTLDYTLPDSTILYDNLPNPFSVNTEIRYEIPEKINSAKLIIHDMQGIELKSFNITQKGIGSIKINSSELKAGMYLYTLLIDNIIIDTKRMLLTKE